MKRIIGFVLFFFCVSGFLFGQNWKDKTAGYIGQLVEVRFGLDDDDVDPTVSGVLIEVGDDFVVIRYNKLNRQGVVEKQRDYIVLKSQILTLSVPVK